MEKGISCKWKQKENGVAKFMSDKVGFQTKAVTKDKEKHYIMIKGSIQEKDITFVNICVPQIGALKYWKQISTGKNWQ